MFTGIIKAMAQVADLAMNDGDGRMTFASKTFDFSSAQLGDSIAVNGCCLTVIERSADRFVADVSGETLSATTLGDWQLGSAVNLEPALRAADPLGGHLVSGHVDGVATVTARAADGDSWRFRITPPAALNGYIARKGSVTIDGVSLTVNDVTDTDFGVNIVPHTFSHTIFGHYAIGSRVNIEVDLVARYIERLMEVKS
ncbi:MAG: riboflavin synthase [Gammaproteobacteria bacterium]